jgi:Nif-specific regulatory protein
MHLLDLLNQLCSRLHGTTIGPEDPHVFFPRLLEDVQAALGGKSPAAFLVARKGNWVPIAQTGPMERLPERLLAEAADQDRPRVQPPWAAIPVRLRGDAPLLLVFQLSDVSELSPGAFAEVIGPAIRSAIQSRLEIWQWRRENQTRQALLKAARRWIGIRDWDRLFEEMATTATRLLGCERATIFQWDRRTRRLVGRPALGIPGGQLHLPDDRGIVGRVIHTGQPARADATYQPEAIDRAVDQTTGYTTHSVLCVPMRVRGELVGAFEVLNKHKGGFTDEDEATLLELAEFAAAALENAKEHQSLVAANLQWASQAAAEVELLGTTPAIEAIRTLVHRVADTELAVLVLGENGTGKEVVARMIHSLSRRRHYPFVPVNCAAIPESLAESELFGHERGAFTDAVQTRPGKFELAGKGTLFLDEIGDLSLGCQAKLLRVLEDRTFLRVGGTVPIHSEARVIAATNRDLAELVRQKRFREDLFYRLNAVTIELPPLRARKEDIPLLARHFLQKFSLRAGRPVPRLTPAAEKALQDYPWPGNVRELRNAMERIVYLLPSQQIDVADLEFLLGPSRRQPGRLSREAAEPTNLPTSTGTLSQQTREFQINLVRTVLDQCQGNLTEAARRLGLHRSNLYRKLRQLGLEIPRPSASQTRSSSQEASDRPLR